MGMFTSIIHPDDGRELQIKCGDDICETYRVGDNVGQWASKYTAGDGYLLDDVYDSYSKRGLDAWVIIRDGVVIAVEPNTDKDSEDDEREGDYSRLRAKYNIQDPPREWWSEELWREKEEREKKYQVEREEFDKSMEGRTPDEKFAAIFTKMISRTMGYSNIAQQIFSIEPMPDGAVLIYNKDSEESK